MPIASDTTRIAAYLPPDLASLVDRVAAIRKVSKARVITDTLRTVQSPLTQLCELIERVVEAEQQYVRELTLSHSRMIRAADRDAFCGEMTLATFREVADAVIDQALKRRYDNDDKAVESAFAAHLARGADPLPSLP